jgi:predicted MFS family arabinose efflux permease
VFGVYRDFLALPGVRMQASAGLLAQVTQQVAPIGMVLVVHDAVGSLALAGFAVAGFSLGVGIARPLQGRLIDRRGPRAVLVGAGLMHTLALVAVVGSVRMHAPPWTVVALAVATGVGLPPVSVAMRVEWGQYVAPDRRSATYSLVFLVQELAILCGPVGFAALVALASPDVALAATAVVAGAGSVALGHVMRASAPNDDERARGGALRDPGMRLLLGVVLLLGGVFGTLEVGIPAFAALRGVPALSGVLVAMLSIGGIVGAIWYGARKWTLSAAVRLVFLLLAVGVALAPLAAVRQPVLVAVSLLAAGLVLNPALTTTSLLVDDLATAAPAEAFGWMSTAIGVGGAAGGAAAGMVAQHAGLTQSLMLPMAFAVLAAALATRLRRTS